MPLLLVLLACAAPDHWLLSSDGSWAPIDLHPLGVDATGAPVFYPDVEMAYDRWSSGRLDVQQALLVDEVLWVRFEDEIDSVAGDQAFFDEGWSWMTLDADGQLALFSAPWRDDQVIWWRWTGQELVQVGRAPAPEDPDGLGATPGLEHAVIDGDGTPLLWFSREATPRAWVDGRLEPVESTLELGPAVRDGQGVLWNAGETGVRSSTGCAVEVGPSDPALSALADGVDVWHVTPDGYPIQTRIDGDCAATTTEVGERVPGLGSAESFSLGSQAMVVAGPDQDSMKCKGRFAEPMACYISDAWYETP